MTEVGSIQEIIAMLAAMVFVAAGWESTRIAVQAAVSRGWL